MNNITNQTIYLAVTKENSKLNNLNLRKSYYYNRRPYYYYNDYKTIKKIILFITQNGFNKNIYPIRNLKHSRFGYFIFTDKRDVMFFKLKFPELFFVPVDFMQEEKKYNNIKYLLKSLKFNLSDAIYDTTKITPAYYSVYSYVRSYVL